MHYVDCREHYIHVERSPSEAAPKQSSGIEEIVAAFSARTEYGGSQPWAIDYIDEILPDIQEWLRTTLTSFESRIRAEEMTKSLSSSLKDTSLCYINGKLVTAVEFLEHHQGVGAAQERQKIALKELTNLGEIQTAIEAEKTRIADLIEEQRKNAPPFPVEEGVTDGRNEAMKWGAQFAYNLALQTILNLIRGK